MKAKLNGFSINYEVTGAEGKPWLTLSNSLATDMRMWDGQVAALSNDFRILRYDKRGHGQSDTPAGPYTMEELAGDVVALWDMLGIEKSYFIGLSIGGMTAQALLLNHPDRLIATVISNSMALCRPEFQAAWDQRIALAQEKGMAALVEPTMERWFTEGFRKTGAPVLDDVRDQIATTRAEGYAGCARAIQKLAYLDRLKTVDHPVLLMAGAHDGGTPESGMALMHKELKGSEYVVLDAAHIANIEQADEYTKNVKAFFARH
ncbi:MAG: 3-oxoadipate enol-lactonase [Rhodospirillaceae bacterium]